MEIQLGVDYRPLKKFKGRKEQRQGISILHRDVIQAAETM